VKPARRSVGLLRTSFVVLLLIVVTIIGGRNFLKDSERITRFAKDVISKDE
jgi:hypothetical protein